jgi:hypothetical protein
MRSFGLFVVAVLTAVLFAYPVTANAASVEATINGGGTAIMDPTSFAQGTTSFGIHATLYDDGSAKGHINCVDQQHDSNFPGNIFGEVTSWEGSLDGGPITLNVVGGKFVGFPGGHPEDADFSVTIQQFGGAGVGHWTLSIGGFTFCEETLLSGHIVMRRRS